MKSIVEYAAVLVVVFGFTALAVSKLAHYFLQQNTASYTAYYADVDPLYVSADKPQTMQNEDLLATYTQHLVSINDPNQGCGCPACCGTI